MELKDIKQQLTISQVLIHYNLKPDKNNRLLCPFHNDKNPSLQIYPATNTYCCFSSNCNAGTGDQIQFIELKENCNKHEALLKAASLLNGDTRAAQPPTATLFIEESTIDRIAVLTKFFNYYKMGLLHRPGSCPHEPSTDTAINHPSSHGFVYKPT